MAKSNPARRRWRFGRRSSAFVFVASVGVWLPKAHAATLVDLDATALPEGPLATWSNAGTVGGDFTSAGDTVPQVTTTAGVKGVSFLGGTGGAAGTHYVGPTATDAVAFSNSRTVEAWVYNPSAQGEETVFAWGRRGGPDGSNASFNHGTNADFGAVGHWGAPDIGWNGKIAFNRWTYIAYTWDGLTTRVYMDGVLVNSETPIIPLNTWEVDTNGNPLPFRIARQNAGAGTPSGTGVGEITISRIRVHDTALDDAAIKAKFDEEKATFWTDADGDGVPDWFENQYAPTLDPAVADGDQDPDGDGLTNRQEFENLFADAPGDALRTNPTLADTDGDGVSDGAEVGRLVGGNPAPTHPLLADTDGDGLPDGVETNTGTFVSAQDTGTDPLVADTDGDGVSDSQEVIGGSNPLDPASVPGAERPPLVALDATDKPLGPLNPWPNEGTLGGAFTPAGNPQVQSIQGVNGVTFNGGNQYYTGPATPTFITGNASRTVEAWIYNPSAADEETIFSWGRRGGPDGTNCSFNHGLNGTWGAVGHWGSPDIGWGPTPDDIALNVKQGQWTYVVYTYDGETQTTRVYSNGIEANSEILGAPLNTWALDTLGRPLPFRVASQNEANGDATANLRGSLTIGELRVYDRVLDPSAIQANFEAGAEKYGNVDFDNDQLPTWYERQYNFLDERNPADAALDQDGDGLTNLVEFQKGTRPDLADTDGDGLSDRVETNTGAFVNANDTGTNPLIPDTDQDGLNDSDEVTRGTNPTLEDTDGDSFADGLEVVLQSNPTDPGSVPSFDQPVAIVNLDATSLPLGPLATWENTSPLGGVFRAPEDAAASVEAVQGIKGVTFDGVSNYYTGPAAPLFMTGNASRTVVAWINNPAAANEETIFAWGRRGGPDGTNCSFNHGTNGAFGAVGHWGAPDIGWGPDAASIAENVKQGVWTFVAYTYNGDEFTTRVYVDGVETNSELIGGLDTHSVDTAGRPLPFRVASQTDAGGGATTGLRGSMTIARVRVYPQALTAEQIAAQYEAEKDFFTMPPLGGPTLQNAAFDANLNTFSFTWEAQPGATYAVEASADLVNWTEVASGLTTGSFSENISAASGNARFYRVRATAGGAP